MRGRSFHQQQQQRMQQHMKQQQQRLQQQMKQQQQRMQRQREMGGWAEMKRKQAMEQARIPDRPLTGDPFADLEHQAAQLRALVAAGHLAQAQLEACLAELMIQDGQERWWMVGAKPGQWYRYDGAKWVADQPPRRGGLPSMPLATPTPKSLGGAGPWAHSLLA